MMYQVKCNTTLVVEADDPSTAIVAYQDFLIAGGFSFTVIPIPLLTEKTDETN